MHFAIWSASLHSFFLSTNSFHFFLKYYTLRFKFCLPFGLWCDMIFVICCLTFAGSHFWETARCSFASQNKYPLSNFSYLHSVSHFVSFWFRWLALGLIVRGSTDQWWSLLFEQLRAQILISRSFSEKVASTSWTRSPQADKVCVILSFTIFKVSSASSLSIVFLCHYFWISIILRFVCESNSIRFSLDLFTDCKEYLWTAWAWMHW